MQVRDLRFQPGDGKRLNATWSESQVLRSIRDPNHTYRAYHNDNTPGVYAIDHVDSEGRYAGEYMDSLDKFELACVLTGMNPVT